MKQLTANLVVESIEACLPFWVGRLGFEKTVEVPHGEGLGFVILKLGQLELMLQSRASLAADLPALAKQAYRALLYVSVDDLGPIRRALDGYPEAMPERTSSYGAREIIVVDPAGNGVCFGAH